MTVKLFHKPSVCSHSGFQPKKCQPDEKYLTLLLILILNSRCSCCRLRSWLFSLPASNPSSSPPTQWSCGPLPTAGPARRKTSTTHTLTPSSGPTSWSWQRQTQRATFMIPCCLDNRTLVGSYLRISSSSCWSSRHEYRYETRMSLSRVHTSAKARHSPWI